MAKPGRYRGPQQPIKPQTVAQGVELVRAYAIGLFDKADGHAADWPVIAQILFKAAFSAVDELPDDARMRSVLRRLEGGTYDRLAGNLDDGLASPVEPGPGEGAAGPPFHAPEPKHP